MLTDLSIQSPLSVFRDNADGQGQTHGVALRLDPFAVALGPGPIRPGHDQVVDPRRFRGVRTPGSAVRETELFDPRRKTELERRKRKEGNTSFRILSFIS